MPVSMTGTRLILIRHGERGEPVPPSNEPLLSLAGLNRAKLLVHVLGRADISAIYTSTFVRTQQTASPLATHLGLTPIVATAAIDIKNHVLSNFRGKTVLVVGHSDTVPQLIGLLGVTTGQEIGPNEFDNMFVATVLGVGKLTVNRLKYGVKT